MWSIDYIAETTDEQAESMESSSVDPTTSVDDKDKDLKLTTKQDSEDLKTDQDLKEDQDSKIGEDLKAEQDEKTESETKTEEMDSCEREAAIKRVEALVKQMSLSQEQEKRGQYHLSRVTESGGFLMFLFYKSDISYSHLLLLWGDI